MTGGEAARDGLLRRDGGRIANGGSMRAPGPRPVQRAEHFGELRTSYRHEGRCDTCKRVQLGQAAMEAHTARTGHRTFTEVHPERFR